MSGQPVATIADQIEGSYRSTDPERLRGLYEPDAVFDATVPQWRFQLQGADRIVAWYRDAYARLQEPRCNWLRVTEGDDLVLVEWEVRAAPAPRSNSCGLPTCST